MNQKSIPPNIQYTIRNVPPAVDAMLKAHAKKQGVSLNTLLLDRLGALGHSEGGMAVKKPKQYHDMDFLIGSMTVQEVDEFDGFIRKANTTDKLLAQAEYDESKIAESGESRE